MGNRVLKILLVLILTLCGSSVYAAKSFEVLEVSSSGESLILDKGQFEGVKLRQYVKFLKDVGTLEKPKLIFIADAEAIKVNDVNSYWLLRVKAKDQKVLPGDKLLLIALDEILEKRSKLKLQKRRVVLDQSLSKSDYMRSKKEGVPKHLIFKDKGLFRGEENFKNKKPIETDIQVTEYATWSKAKGTQYVDKFMTEVGTKRVQKSKRTVSKGKAIEAERKKIFNSVVSGVTKKVNSLPDGLDGLYREQRRERELAQMKEKSEVVSIYDSYQAKKKKSLIPPSVYEREKKEGIFWSAGMSDKELRKYIVKSGIEQEELRQKRSLTSKTGHELILSFGTSLADNTTPDDESFRGKGSSFSLGYEFHLIRMSPSLRNWSVDLYGLKGVDYISLGSNNGKFSHTSFKLGVNWYFMKDPTALNTYMWYLGTGIHKGVAAGKSANFSKEYEFQTIGLPSFYVGTKYRFLTGDSYSDAVKVGIAVNIRLSSEPISYTSSDIITDNIESEFSIIDYKLRLGMSLYF